MNVTELKDHLRETMRGTTAELTAHLREMGIEGTLPTQKQALVKLHADHHGSAPLTGADAVGAEVTPEPAKRPAPRPARKTPAKETASEAAERRDGYGKPARKAPARKPATKTAPARTRAAKAAPAKVAPARKAPAKTTAKAPARKAPAAPKPETKANGSDPVAPSANASKHDLAKRLIDMVAAEFANESPENKAKLSYWLHGLPTGYPNGGGGGYLRYWPAGLPRPTTAGWRKPE